MLRTQAHAPDRADYLCVINDDARISRRRFRPRNNQRTQPVLLIKGKEIDMPH
jgi:hypothetical protein